MVEPKAVTAGVWSLLREARRKAGLTQRQLAERAGTSQSAVARYERAKAMPDIHTLQRLVEACGFDLRYTIQPRDFTFDRQIQDAVARSPEARLEVNRRLTRLAAKASAARVETATRGTDA